VALVEFAIIMPVLFMIVFGMLTGGMVMNRQLSLTHATREAARYGATVTQDQYPPAQWAQHVREVAVQRSGGELAAANVCVALVGQNAANPPQTVVYSSTNGTSPCIADGVHSWRVQVTATLPGQEINGIFFSVPLTLTSDATAKHEE
jgi:Flp pilus assembly protein TadG